MKKYVKRATLPLRPEVKRTIDFYTETTVDAVVTPYQYYELIVGQGSAAPQRSGMEILLIGLSIRSWFRNNGTTTQFVRALVLSCASDTDTTIATMELFADSNVAGTPTTLALSGTSPINVLFPINKAKFKIHYDHVFKLGGSGATGGEDVKVFNRFVRFRSKIKFDAASTGGKGDASRRFFVLYLTSDPLLDAGGAAIEISGSNKWYFTDA